MSASYAELYASHATWLLRFVIMLVHDVHAAEDIVADTFAKVHGPWQAGRIDHPRAYLRATAANLAANHLRHRDVVRRARLRLDADRRGRLEPEQELCDRDELLVALRSLTVNQRVAVVLRFYDDASFGDIADQLGCSQGTVRTHLSRGLSRLRDQLGPTAERMSA